MEKKFFLAFALSLIILLGYPTLLTLFYGPQERAKEKPYPAVNEKVIESVVPPDSIPKKEEIAPFSPLVLETEKIRLLFHPKEGSLRGIFLKEYLDAKKEPMELVKVEDSTGFIGNMWSKIPIKTHILYDEVEQTDHKIIFKGMIGEGIYHEKEYELVPSSYTLTCSLVFKNGSPTTVPVYYTFVAVSGLTPLPHEENFFAASLLGQGKRRNFSFDRIKKGAVSAGERTEWVALKEKYFSLILKPEGTLSGYTITPTENRKSMAVHIFSMPQSLPPGGEHVERYLLYLGPNQLKEIKTLGPWVEGVFDYGFFGGITKVLLWTLLYIHHLVKNYGLAIILLTFLVSVLFLPLTGISYKSMKKMKLIQPEVIKIRELYKDKPQKINRELMDLYKRNKVNPLGGCLPMLIQMPIFIAFYNALIHSIELKGASFLFVKDLSMPDQAIPLPFPLGPLGGAINVLPILMVIAMVIQQKLTSPVAGGGREEETQRKMMTWMPVVFGFIFYGLPSGLVLYWLTNNVIMIVTQKAFLSR